MAEVTSITGPDMLRALDEALRDVRREEDELARRLARNVELTVKLRQTEGELMRRLAGIVLEPEIRAALTGSLTQAEVEARSLLDRHGPELEAAEAALRELDQKIAGLDAERAELRNAADHAERAVADLAERFESSSNPDPVQAAAREAAIAARQMAREALKKARQAEADRELKGRPFRDDPLFTYLWGRAYGTSGYHKTGIVAALDGWVSRLIGYERASRAFSMLSDIPLRLAAHADALEARAQETETELSRLERAAIDAAGGRDEREMLDHAAARIREIDAEVVVLEDERDEAARRRRELAQGSEPPFSAAIDSLSGALEREDVRTLLRQGRSAGNDGLVRQIDELRARTAEEESDTRDLRGRLRVLATRRRELEDIRYEFKRHGYDEPRSRFDEPRLAADMLNDFLRGGIAAADYWGRLRRNHSMAEAAARPRRGFGWLAQHPAADNPPEPASTLLPTIEVVEFTRPRAAERKPPRPIAARAGA